MKVRIIKTGEVYNIPEYARLDVSECDSYGTPLNFGYDEIEIIPDLSNTILLKHEKTIDWEQRRYELAKEAMNGILSNSRWDKVSDIGFFKSNVVGNAISYADEIIEKIKNDENKRNDIQSTK